ncbi:class II aldolase/adducin family protein [Sphingobium sp. EM0848]|uniref:class II aldolase/adducin family protein n=1 Tax=Sphingobium sp. EM0848 TaxID=2743473 RepID=UPI00159C79B8|nr:class II aldolase/adducin family protein [Sphingobium sp. EM0848]
MQNDPAQSTAAQIDAERAARQDLAAAYRMIDRFFPTTDGIYNHLSLRVPGEPRQFLIKRHALLYREVTASNLVRVDMDADLDESSGVNRPGFVLHSGVLRARPDVACVFHMHGATGIAMSAHGGGLRMISQAAIRFYKRIGYHPFEGVTDNPDERERLAAALGDNHALFLRNHGIVVVGSSVRETFERTRDLMTACESQLMLEAATDNIVEVPDAICESTVRQLELHDRGRGKADWPAWRRLMDEVAPGYAE